MKPNSKKAILLTLLIIFLAAQSAVIGWTVVQIYKLKTGPTTSSDAAFITGWSALNGVAMTQPAVSVKDNTVYLTDLKIALPLTPASINLLYDTRQVGDQGDQLTYDVTTRALESLLPVNYQKEIACYPLRLAFEAKPNPYNPHENNYAAVKLADGRTLQIYPFENSKCDAQYQAASVKPDDLKQLFIQAKSY